MRFLVVTAAAEGAVPHAAVMDWLREGGPFIASDAGVGSDAESYSES
jgi:hypothetical protein